MYNFEKIKENQINCLEVKDKKLTIKTYDKFVECVLKVKIDGLSVFSSDCVIFLGPKQTKALKELFKAEGTLEITDKQLIAKTSLGTYRTQYIKEELNPDIIENGKELNVDINKLKNAAKFCDKQGKRPVLTGVHIEPNKIIATDGFKLYYSYSDDKEANLTIPYQFLEMIENDMALEYTATSVIAKNETVTIVGKLLEGNYPNVDKLIGDSIVPNDTINIDVLKEFTSFAKNIGSEVLSIKEDKIIARTKENSLEKEFKSNYSISFIINNLTSILALIDRKECDVNYTSEVKPITFFNYSENYILIPCRVGE